MGAEQEDNLWADAQEEDNLWADAQEVYKRVDAKGEDQWVAAEDEHLRAITNKYYNQQQDNENDDESQDSCEEKD